MPKFSKITDQKIIKSTLLRLQNATKTTKILAITIILVSSSVFAFALPGISQANKSENSDSPQSKAEIFKVKTLKLDSNQTTDNGQSISFDGKVTNETEVRISASTPAMVKTVNFTRGKEVKKGELLATLGGKKGPHPLQVAVSQAQVNLVNLDTNLSNLDQSNQNNLDKADQQIKNLNSSLADLQKTSDLTKESSKITIIMAEQSLKSLEGDILRQEAVVRKASDSINGSIEAQKASSKAFIEQTSTGLVNSLSSLSGVLPSSYIPELNQQISSLNGFKTVDPNNVDLRLSDFQSALNNLISFSQNLVQANALGPAGGQTITLLSTSAASGKAQAVSQLANLNNTGVNRESQTSQGVSAIDSLKSKRTDLELALDKARNGTLLQEQAAATQINSLNQQLENAKLLAGSAQIGAKTQIDSTEGQRKLLELQLQNAQTQLSSLSITSPIDGIVTDVRIVPDQDVSVGLELVTIYGTGGKYVRGYLKPKDVAAIDTKKEVELTLAGDSKPSATGKVNMLYPVADATTGLIPFDLEILDPKNQASFVAGAKIEGKFKINSEDVNISSSIFVPTNLVSIDKDEKFVYVVESGKVVKKIVVLGPSSGDKVEVISGLKGDEELIINNLDKIKADQQVEIER